MEAECVKRHFLNIPISHEIFLQLTPAPSWPKGKMTPTTTQDLMRKEKYGQYDELVHRD